MCERPLERKFNDRTSDEKAARQIGHPQLQGSGERSLLQGPLGKSDRTTAVVNRKLPAPRLRHRPSYELQLMPFISKIRHILITMQRRILGEYEDAKMR